MAKFEIRIPRQQLTSNDILQIRWELMDKTEVVLDDIEISNTSDYHVIAVGDNVPEERTAIASAFLYGLVTGMNLIEDQIQGIMT